MSAVRHYRAIAASCVVAASALALAPISLSARSNGIARPPRVQTTDIVRRIDANRINMWSTNIGSFAFNLSAGDFGLEYPKGTGFSTLFAAGLWMGATVGGEVRTVVAEYSHEYGPGAMAGGTYTDPNLPEYVVYKVVRWTGDPQDSAHVDRLAPGPLEDPLEHHSWSEYMAGAAPFGAPWRMYRLPITDTPAPDDSVYVPGPDVLGDQMLWAVYNDANPANHTNNAGNSTPLGVEIQQTAWAVDELGILGLVVRLEFKIINKGANMLDSAFVSLWSDPDIGGGTGFTDDLVGCDTLLDLGYAYNSNNADAQYGSSPPSVGLVMLRGPEVGGDPLPMTAFAKYINGTDPSATSQSYNYMVGLNADGSPIVDPFGVTTQYMVAGDPVNPGPADWLDNNPADRRMMLSSGPFQMAPGDTQTVSAAIILGHGADRLASISRLKILAALLQGLPTEPPPAPEGNCPREPAFWTAQCDPETAVLTAEEMSAIAVHADSQSLYFEWSGSELDSLCANVPADSADIRSEARKEYAALLANFAAGILAIAPEGELPIQLRPSTPIACPAVTAVTLEQLVEKAFPATTLRSADYLNNNPTNRRALTGLDWGGAGFFGGAGPGSHFFGSTIDPATHPDSFSTVELTFTGTQGPQGQKAYRFKRLEQASNGAPPPQGRGYLYGGFHECDFFALDTDHALQLDVAFVERVLTADDGTILPDNMQPARTDSTWNPSDDPLGDREYLMVIRRPYSSVEKPEIARDGALIDNTLPVLWALWARLRTPSDVIDPGDAFRFLWSPFGGRGVDTRMLELEPEPLSDPNVQQAYADLVQCVGDINRGIGLELMCNPNTAVDEPEVDGATPTRLALAGFVPNPGRGGLSVEFVLPTRDPARLDVYDLQGRRLVSREVGDRGPGRVVLSLEGSMRLRPGIYILALTQRGETASRKGVVVR